MPPPPPLPAPATAGVARQLYAEGLPVSEIARRTGLSRSQVYYWADRLVGADGRVSHAPSPRRGSGVRPPAGKAGADRAEAGTAGMGEPEAGKSGAGKSGAGRSAPRESGSGESGSGTSGAGGSDAGKPQPRTSGMSRAGTGRSGARKPGASSSLPAAPDMRRPATEAGHENPIRVAGSPDRPPVAPVPRRRGSPRARLLARLWQAAERQVAEIEARIAAAGLEAGSGEPRAAADTEKDARALALLARTLRELSAAEGEGSDPQKAKAASAHDTVRDLDVFRRELARRLDRLREGGPGAGPAG